MKSCSLAFCITACLAVAVGTPGLAETLPDAPQPQQQPTIQSKRKPVPATRPANPNAVEARKWSDVVEPGEKIPVFTTRDKLIYPLREDVEITAPLSILTSAALGLWIDGDPEYGTNGVAFGKRVGVAALGQTISRELTDGLLPIAFHQDPRYYRQATGTYKDRGEHAVRSVLFSHNDAGHVTFNYSDVLGLGIAASLTQTYYPEQSVHASVPLKQWGYSLLALGGVNLFDEFYPDVKRKLFHKSQ